MQLKEFDWSLWGRTKKLTIKVLQKQRIDI
jgi:hypothetical protein